ncbi:serine/threonine protein kinase [Plasmodium falciparum Tanzania (2000708)]|uniref:Serine/threonine protein kinase n=1 Tax=Plasmodium falciparum Tanzania (2000708) TaxID=1036725 RepID=A0A024VYG3_PLAFA|nr:serine/threonine protein kinase [Plasmodium falciparum Tanzania (2000708)]
MNNVNSLNHMNCLNHMNNNNINSVSTYVKHSLNLNNKNDFNKNAQDESFQVNKNTYINNGNNNYLENVRNAHNNYLENVRNGHNNYNSFSNIPNNNMKENYYHNNLNIASNNKNIPNNSVNNNNCMYNKNEKLHDINNNKMDFLKCHVDDRLSMGSDTMNNAAHPYKNSVLMNPSRKTRNSKNEEILNFIEDNGNMNERILSDVHMDDQINERRFISKDNLIIKCESNHDINYIDKNQKIESGQIIDNMNNMKNNTFYQNNKIIPKNYVYNNKNIGDINNVVLLKTSLNYKGIINADKKMEQANKNYVENNIDMSNLNSPILNHNIQGSINVPVKYNPEVVINNELHKSMKYMNSIDNNSKSNNNINVNVNVNNNNNNNNNSISISNNYSISNNNSISNNYYNHELQGGNRIISSYNSNENMKNINVKNGNNNNIINGVKNMHNNNLICYRNMDCHNYIINQHSNSIPEKYSKSKQSIGNYNMKNKNVPNVLENIGACNNHLGKGFYVNKHSHINDNKQNSYDVEQGNYKYISNSSDLTKKKKKNHENMFRMSKSQLLSLESDIKYLQSLTSYMIKPKDLYFETFEEIDVFSYDKNDEYINNIINGNSNNNNNNNNNNISNNNFLNSDGMHILNNGSGKDYGLNGCKIMNKDFFNGKMKREIRKTKYYTNKYSNKLKYTVIEEGSFGVVYKGWYKGMHVAVKVPVDKMARQDPYGLTKRSINEWKILAKCDHPNIIKLCGGIIHSYFDIWLVTKLVNGLDLHTIKNNMNKDEKVLGIDISLKMCRQLAEVINFLHTPIKNKKNVIIHRDIKPENLIIDSDWNIHLCDFGDAEECEDGIVTNVSGATWIYAPPELLTCHPLKQSSDYNFLDHTKLSYKWDIWSMGCVFQEMMNLPSPFQHYIITFDESDQIYEKLVDVFTKKLPPCIHSKIENSPFADIIRLCLNYDPNLRPTASEIVQLLNQPDEYLLLKRK